MNEDDKEREEELKSQQYAEWAGVHIPTNEEKMTSALESISLNAEALSGMSQGIEQIRYDTLSVCGSVNEIEKKLDEWSYYSKNSPFKYHEEAITQNLDAWRNDLKENMTVLSGQLRDSFNCLRNIQDTLGQIKQNQKRSKLIPILLSLILIVLLIK